MYLIFHDTIHVKTLQKEYTSWTSDEIFSLKWCEKHRNMYKVFILVFNQLDAQNLFYNKFYFTPLHVSSTIAYRQEVKIALYSLWYHHTYRCDDTRGCIMQFLPPDDEHMVLKICRGVK